MKYIRHFDSQTDYNDFIDSLAEDASVLVGGPTSVYLHRGGSQPVQPNNIIYYTTNNGSTLNQFTDTSNFGADLTLVSNTYEDGMGKAVFSGDVTEIGASAFISCTPLTNITIPGSVTSINAGAFMGCNHLSSINIPASVTSIGEGAFDSCGSLTSITIPNSVTEIGEGAFAGCRNLSSINIPSDVTKINNSTFRSCTSLTSINIPEGVTEIGADAFSDCNSLTSITIPEGVTKIGMGAFVNCRFDRFTYRGTIAQWNIIEMVEGWSGYMTIIDSKIHCSDGDITF